MPRYQLWDSQIQDLAFFMNNPKAANFSDPGTGKTPVTCVWFEWLWKHKGYKGIFAGPKSLLAKNKNEFYNFTDFAEEELQIVDGTPSQRLSQIMNPKAKVLLMGYTRLAEDWKTVKKFHPQLGSLAVDEMHLGFKTNEAQRTMELYRAMRHIPYFMAMTGSPIDGGLHTVYPLLKIIAPQYYPSYQTFVRQHGIVDPTYGGVVAWRGHDKIKTILGRHSIRRTFEDVHGDEFPFITAEPCKQFASQQKAYDEMHETGMTELDDDFLVATQGGVNALRCRQLLAHPETFGITGPNGRDAALKDHLLNHKRNGKPLIIYSAFIPEQERVAQMCRDLGLTVQVLNSNHDNPNIDAEFRAGKYQVVVASPRKASVGFNWPHVDHVIFLSLDYSDTNFTQAFKRAIRGKRGTKLLVTILFYPDTVERKVCCIIDDKSRTANKVDSTYCELFLRHAIDKATHS